MRTTISKIIMMLALVGGMFASCSEKSNIDAPGSNDHNLPDRDVTQADTSFIDDWSLITIPAQAISADSACKICKKMVPDVTSTETYDIYGYISELSSSPLATDYGNAFYYIKSHPWDRTGLYCYQIMWLNGTKYQSLEQIYIGQRVVVRCHLINYGGSTPETQGKGDAYVLSSSYREKVPETQGDGTEANPYTAADIRMLGALLSDTYRREGDTVYVRGYICGAAEVVSETKWQLQTKDFDIKTNVMVGDMPGDTIQTGLTPIKLPKGDIRRAINLSDNPDNMGKLVTIWGTLGYVELSSNVYGIDTPIEIKIED